MLHDVICSANFCTFKSVVFDGGELGYSAGEFSQLVHVPKEQWDMMEKIIREKNAKEKGKSKL